MPRKEGERGPIEMMDRLRRELGDQGYIVRVSTERVDEDNLVVRLELTDVETKESYARIIAIGKLMETEVALGFHLSENIVADLATKGLAFLAAVRTALPTLGEAKVREAEA